MPPKKSTIYDEPPEFYGDYNNWDKHIDRILRELQRLYNEDILPIEEQFHYDTLKPSWFGEALAQKRPFVTVLGPYSAGKSTFINYLMQSNYLLTGPQPTTDKFTVIMHGDKHSQISGKVLCADQKQPFRGLNQFGEKFIECFGAVTAPHPILQSLSIIDTPGLLENQSGDHRRRYDYMEVVRWFVERSDLICVLFDPSKLDAGAELKNLFDIALRGNEQKTRFIMNKADSVSAQELMRVYGGLFWNLSKLVHTTEPPRVFVSSFWDQPYRPDTDHALFTDEKADLLYDMTEVVPLQSLDNRVTSVISRCKSVYNHVLVCMHMKSRLPLFGKDKAIKEMLANLPEIYKELAYTFKTNADDFPNPTEYINFCQRVDISTLSDPERCKRKGWLETLGRIMGEDLPALLKPIHSAEVADPRDRKHALLVQREYSSGMKKQLMGESGGQGSLGGARLNTHRAEGLPNAALLAEQIKAQQQAQIQKMIEDQMMAQTQLANTQNQMTQNQMFTAYNQMGMVNPMAMGMGGMNTMVGTNVPLNPMALGAGGMVGMGGMNVPGGQLALMPNPAFGVASTPTPNMSHDQLMRLTQMLQQQQPTRPHQPRY